jgi:phenylacetic acid degradation operon negative regulatory protein
VIEPDIEGLLRPLSARSLIASALLGSHPPSLPGRLLVAMAERFGISGGTARVALSRMVDRAELVNVDGVYSLGGALLERQDRQDRSRSGTAPWDGSWEQAVVIGTGRPAADRSKLRRDLAVLGLGELREGVWMRPGNLDVERQPSARTAVSDQVEWLCVAPIAGTTACRLAGQLFDLDGWAATANALSTAVTDAQSRLTTHDDAVVTGFNLASATLRHLVHDPGLPAELEPPGWPAESLRATYDQFEAAYQTLLRDFFRAVPGRAHGMPLGVSG